MTQIIILAAGRGSRMGSELPKVLVPLRGKPMICYLMESLMAAKSELKPIVIVSPDNKKIISEALAAYQVDYAIQEEQLGTGHAVSCARDYIDSRASNIFVLNGDHPFYQSETIKNFPLKHQGVLSMITVVLPNFRDWYLVFYHWGRIIRNKDKNIQEIKEFKDATDEEKEILEVNPNCFCFNKDWFFSNIDKVRDDNKAHEFYLTDMVKIAFSQNRTVYTSSIEPYEAIGINSPEELEIAEKINI